MKREKQQGEEEIQALAKKYGKKAEFFMAASHQLKSPLAIIQWCLQSVIESESTDPKTQELVHKALSQTSAMSQLITDMLHVFRLENRALQSQDYTYVDVNEVLDQVIVQYELMAHQHKVHILRSARERVPNVFVDAGYLKQALVNLLDNAIKYSRSGGKVTIMVSEAKDHFVEVAVHDEGIGIAEADQEQLFKEFFRSVEARQVAHEGTGLGLVLVRHIVEEFGGEVKVESQVHHGSTFIIRLPTRS